MVGHPLNVLDQLTVTPHHHVSSEDTAVTILDDQDVHIVGRLVGETTTIDATEVKSHTVEPTQVALSVPQQGAVLTVAVAIAIQTVTVTTVMKDVADDQDVPLTQTIKGVIVGDLTGDVTPRLLQRMTPVLVHALIAAGSIISGDTNVAVVAAPAVVVGVAALVLTDAAATVAVAALLVVHLAPPRALHIGTVTTGDLTARCSGRISTGRESTIPSLQGPLPAHKHETATLHRHKEKEVVVELPQKREGGQQNIEIHSQLDNSWRKFNLKKEGMNLVLAAKQASRSRTPHRDTSGPSSPLPLETKVCCPFLASSKQERSLRYFLLHVQPKAKSQSKGKIRIVMKLSW